MKEKAFKVSLFLVSAIVHLAILAVILKLWLPIASWYFNQIPAKGIDLFNTVSYVTYLLKDFSLPVNSWRYVWFGGVPLLQDYSWLYFYLILPLTKFFSVPQAVQVFALGGAFAFIAFCYLLFAQVSKNRVLAAILALSVAYSVNIYLALVYAGGIPVFVTQAMFPLVMLMTVKFLNTGNRRFLVLAALTSGLGVLGHPQSFINFIFPAVFLLLFFSSSEGIGFLSREKIKNMFFYGLITFLISLPGLYYRFFSNFVLQIAKLFNVNLLGIAPPEGSKAPAPEVVEWARNQFYVSFTGSNRALLHLFGALFVFFILGVIVRKTRKKAIVDTLAILLVAFWVIFYIYLLSIGINIYHGGWEAWYKLFWAVPVAIGLCASQFWGVLVTAISERISTSRAKILSLIGLEAVSGVLLLFLALTFFPSYTQGVLARIEKISAYSSASPEGISGRLTQEGQEQVKREMTPSFLKDSPGEYRIYCNDQTTNLAWNSFFETPLARGYIDPPLGLKERWGFFWLDAAFGMGCEGGTSLGDDWNTPEPVVENNITFLLDWYAIGYLEGNHHYQANLGQLPPLLTSEKFVLAEEEPEVLGGIAHDMGQFREDIWEDDRLRMMHFYQIKDEWVSPIHQATNAPAVLVIGGGDSFDIITRFLGMMGLSSQEVIVARGPAFIDKISFTQMMDFDAIILYKYDYGSHSKAWSRIAKYLEKGGRVFIDTEPEVKESSSVELPGGFPKNLPEVFPIKQTKRGDLGKAWVKEVGDFELFKDIETEKFSPFKFDDQPWNISYPPEGRADVREGAKVLLSSHGYPVLVEQEVGLGKVIWSGINLPYHVLYNYNFEEGKLLVNVFARLFQLGGTSRPESTLDWVSPQKRVIASQNAKGVLFKELAFPGWQAKVQGEKGSSKLAIYKVGPASPGFMYVRIPEKIKDGEFKVIFNYRGPLIDWFICILSLITIFFALDYIIFGRRFVNFLKSLVWFRVQKRTGLWWDEDDYQ